MSRKDDEIKRLRSENETLREENRLLQEWGNEVVRRLNRKESLKHVK